MDICLFHLQNNGTVTFQSQHWREILFCSSKTERATADVVSSGFVMHLYIVKCIGGEAVRKFRKRFPAVSVEVHVPDELLLVPMDAILIMQVLSNLMENAVFHGGTTTHIALSAQRDGPWARFYVRDNGQGIPPQKLHTLFSGALRCEDSSPGDGKRNMGLGLSVCMAIIRAHGGTLEAKNLESGAEFSFCLPLTKEEVS